MYVDGIRMRWAWGLHVHGNANGTGSHYLDHRAFEIRSDSVGLCWSSLLWSFAILV